MTCFMVSLVWQCLVLSATASWYHPDYLATDCSEDEECSCVASGRWQSFDNYFKLQALESQISGVEYWAQSIDLSHIIRDVKEFSEKLDRFELGFQNIGVEEALKQYTLYEKEMDALSQSAGITIGNGSIETSILRYETEINAIMMELDKIWTVNPYAEIDRLNDKISSLTTSLANCQVHVNDTYFMGDRLPLTPEAQDWCDHYELESIGDSLAHGIHSHSIGSWFKDPFPANKDNITNIYLRSSKDTKFSMATNYSEFVDNLFTNSWPKYIHTAATWGFGYAFYKGSLFYHYNNILYKYSVNNGSTHSVPLTPSVTEYLQHSTVTRVDMKADEYGLYAVYTLASNSEKLIITKINPVTLAQEKTWYTNSHKATVCAAFMVCGSLYTVDNCWSRLKPESHHEQYVYNTRTGLEHYTNIHLTAKFGHVWTASYNSRERVIFAFDNYHPVTYPVIWKPKTSNEPLT